jgi:hypothetical protein
MDNKPSAESFRQLTTSVEKLPASMGQQSRISNYATQRARLLLGCYRSGDANDPETYVAAIAATLARYSEEIITSVTHPVSGLPSKKSWLPTVKEVHDACDELDEFERRKVARVRGIKEQLEARRQDEIDREQRPTLEEMKARYGEDWGLTAGQPKAETFKAPSWQAIASTYSADPSRLVRLLKAAADQHPQSHESAE